MSRQVVLVNIMAVPMTVMPPAHGSGAPVSGDIND